MILEPDGLGIIPYYTTLEGVAEWCRPAEADPGNGGGRALRHAELRHRHPRGGCRTRRYTSTARTPAWLNIGENASRSRKAGIEDADGFFLNVSNYQYHDELRDIRPVGLGVPRLRHRGHAGRLPRLRQPLLDGGPANEWTGVAMSPYRGMWSPGNPDPL